MTNSQPSVLLASSDTKLEEIIIQDMQKNNINVKLAANGNDAIKLTNNFVPDILVLTQELDGLTGKEVWAILRSKPKTKATPIIMLARDPKGLDAIKGINGGIDDYLAIPFAPSELIKRIRAILRSLNPSFSSRVLEFEDIRMDLDNMRITRNDKELHLGNIEFRILQCLMEYPKEVLSREKIISRVWGENRDVDPRTVDVHINRLRTLLKTNNDYIPLIKTVRSMGYCLRGALIR